MKIQTNQLLEDLKNRTLRNIEKAKEYQELSEEQLNWKENTEKWSVLECLEHLNLYGDFYLPEIKNKMAASTVSADATFKSGWLGNYFAMSMLPKEKLNVMKTFKDKNPVGSDLDKSIIERFLSQQYTMLELLDKASSINLNKVKTGISISNWIKLKLGDTFRVVIYHNDRHIVQADKVLALQLVEV